MRNILFIAFPVIATLISACNKLEAPSGVSTSVIEFNSVDEFKCVGNVSQGEELQNCGFVWSYSQNPTFENDDIIPAPPGLSFETTDYWNIIDDSEPVYIRAFAVNNAGVGYGEEFQFPKIKDDEDFVSSIWETAYKVDGNYYYSFKPENGFYKMFNNDPSHFHYKQKTLNLASSLNYLMEINFKRIKDDPTYKDCQLYFGFGETSSSTYYLVVEPGNAYYVIANKNKDSGIWTDIKDWTRNYGLNSASNNKIQIQKINSTYYFYINGSRIYTWNTSTTLTPIIRLGVGTGEIWVDDYQILDLSVGEGVIKSARVSTTPAIFTSGIEKSKNK